MRICIPLRVLGNPNSGCLTGVATGQCRNTIGELECEVMTDEVNRTKKWFKRSDIRPIGNTGIAPIENKSQAWIDNMMAQRGSVIQPNFNSVNNTPALNKQWNALMKQQGLPHRVGTGNENLESPYLSQADCPPGATFDDGGRPQGQNSAMNKCIPPTSQADCPSDSVFQDSSYPDGPQCLLTHTPGLASLPSPNSTIPYDQQPGYIDPDTGLTDIEMYGQEKPVVKKNHTTMWLFIGGFVFYAYNKGLLTIK